MDLLPSPNRSKIDMSSTWIPENIMAKVPFPSAHSAVVLILASGVVRHVYGQSYRRRSPATVAGEMEFIQKHYNPDQLWFVDDVFTVSHKWLNDFQLELRARNIHIPFECITRADRLTLM
ncbi:MAG: hypothetical protein IPI77_15445 [Saprospiraceae bacterium]|nr:hypothetical protein [Saprospiraceae bacterium]